MFTGIIEELGKVKKLNPKVNLFVLKVAAKEVLAGTKKGDSIAVNGVCLTVANIKHNILTFDIMKETILRTTLKNLKANDRVNLERALTVDSRFSGHFVTGHIDDIGRIKKRIARANYTELDIETDEVFPRFIVPKGSISVDGVSLTVGKVNKNSFSVYLIPFTKKATTLGFKSLGDMVNIEIDILAKYILK